MRPCRVAQLQTSLPAIAAITGAFITMGVAASGAAAFHHAMVQDAATDTPGADHMAIRMASVHDGARQVYTEITISAAAGHLSLDGDVSPVTLYNGTHTIPGGELLPAGSMNAVSYSGLLETTRPGLGRGYPGGGPAPPRRRGRGDG